MDRLRTGVLMLLVAGLAGCAGSTERPADLSLPMSDQQAPPAATRDSLSILADVQDQLVPVIGGYPPRLEDAAQRQRVGRIWSALVVEARHAARAEAESGNARYLLAELYRMGHNLGVAGAALAAQTEIQACLQADPAAVGCHFSRVRYHLAVAPQDLDAAETSLRWLQEHFGLDFNEEVERGFVFLAVYRQQPELAQRRIADYRALFPDSAQLPALERLRAALAQGQVRIDQQR